MKKELSRKEKMIAETRAFYIMNGIFEEKMHHQDVKAFLSSYSMEERAWIQDVVNEWGYYGAKFVVGDVICQLRMENEVAIQKVKTR